MTAQETTLDPIVGVHDHTQGPQTALVTLVEYGDYQCSLCGQAQALVHDAQQRLGSRLRFVFRHFVMPGGRPTAQHAAEAAEAAGAQDRFWELHDALFAHQGALDNGCLVEYADTLGLDVARFLRDMTAHTHATRVREDREGGLRSGVSGTPTFFINGTRHGGPRDAETLLAAAEAAVALLEESGGAGQSDGRTTDGSGR